MAFAQARGQPGFRGPWGGRTGLLFSFVHSIDDQKSANILLRPGFRGRIGPKSPFHGRSKA